MNITVYYAKINLRSHILEVYNENSDLDLILKKLIDSIKNGITYSYSNTYKGKESNCINYKFASIKKLNEDYNYAIVGKIIKEDYIYAKQRDEFGKRKKVRVKNEEEINFYFDVLNEVVAFHTTKRFGRKQFLVGMKNLINKSINMNKSDEKYLFDIVLLRASINLDYIKEELSKIGDIKVLKINTIPPNPNRSLLKKIRQNGDKAKEHLSEMNAGNLTGESILFESDAPGGMKLDAPIIQEKLNRVESLHSELSSEEAIKNGYVKVMAESKAGRIYSSNAREPLKDVIEIGDEQDANEFAIICRINLKSINV